MQSWPPISIPADAFPWSGAPWLSYWLPWTLLGIVPPLLILLYFLKLRRQPLEVPSTYLWSRAIEDLHVNSIWQRLRQSLLLLLQLLLLALLLLACLRPLWQGTTLVGERFIFLIDNSASMNATDVEAATGGAKTTRLEFAKSQVRNLIEAMKPGQQGMILACSDTIGRFQGFSGDPRELLDTLERVRPSNHPTDLAEAFRFAASLVNPSSVSDGDVAPRPAKLLVFSDGAFPTVTDFAAGSLALEYRPIGSPAPENLAITAFSTERNPEKPGTLNVFAQVENFGEQAREVEVHLKRDGQLIDAARLDVAPGGGTGAQFSLADVEAGVLELQLQLEDALALDNRAWSVVNPARRAKVLLVTAGNDHLSLALSTQEALKIADVKLAEPAVLQTEAYLQEARAGAYDLVIYDQCAPPEMPQASTLFFGSRPPLDSWQLGEPGSPLIVDTERVHPLMQLLDLGPVRILDARPVSGPAGATSLVDSQLGSLFAVAPRQGFEDAVLGFGIYTSSPSQAGGASTGGPEGGSGSDESVGDTAAGAATSPGTGGREPNTNWPLRQSFPVFMMNVLKYLGGASSGLGNGTSARPGEPVAVRTDVPVQQIEVTTPAGQRSLPLRRQAESSFVYTETEELGPYAVLYEGQSEASQHFAVNLFDPQESSLATHPTIDLEVEQLAAATEASVPAKHNLWKLLLLIGLGVLIFEWYVYNRRVYI